MRASLQPKLDDSNGKYKLNIPAMYSATGKRQRLWFDAHSEALAEAKRIRDQHHQYGLSAKMLPRRELNESEEAWDILGKAGLRQYGMLRRAAIQLANREAERKKTITLDELFDLYLAKLAKDKASEKYIREVERDCRKRFVLWKDDLLTDIHPVEIEGALEAIPSLGNRKHIYNIVRTVFNFAVNKHWLRENPVSELEMPEVPKSEIKALPNAVVAAMLNDAAAHNIELLPSLAIGFFTGIREAEISKLLWSDVHLNGDGTGHVLVRPEVSKTRRRRYPDLPPNAVEWLDLYFAKVGGRPAANECITRAFTRDTLYTARRRNYRSALGNAKAQWPTNSKRRTYATNLAAAYEDFDRLALYLGHTTSDTSFEHYAGGTTKALGLEYFNIRPVA